MFTVRTHLELKSWSKTIRRWTIRKKRNVCSFFFGVFVFHKTIGALGIYRGVELIIKTVGGIIML